MAVPGGDEPTEIRVRLGGRTAPDQPLDFALGKLVEDVVRRAYTHARVIVSLDPALAEDLVVVVGDEGDTHGGAVRKLVVYARARSQRGRL